MGAKPYSAYRDSGVEWIGEIPEHWEVKRIGLLLSERNARVGNQNVKLLGLSKTKGIQSREDFGNRASVATSYENYKLTESGYIVMNKMQAWNGVFGISYESGMVSPDYAVYEPKSNVNQYFFVYIAKTDLMAGVFHRYSRGMGTAFLRLNTPEFYAIPIPSPPLEEQKQIAAFLDRETSKIDTLIGKQQQLINLLKEKRGSLISHTVTKGLNPDAPMKDSGVEWIGEIPEHWEVKKLKNHIESKSDVFVDGDWIESPYITDNGYRLVQTGNVGIGRYKEQGNRYISPETFKQLRCTEVLPDDLLICRLADPVGRACMAPNLGVRMVTSVDVAILRLGNINQHQYLTYFFSSSEYLLYMESVCRGGTRDRVSRSFLGSVFLPSPPLEEQKQIASFLDAETSKIDSLIDKANQSIALLKERRSSLISAAVTGKIDVREAA